MTTSRKPLLRLLGSIAILLALLLLIALPSLSAEPMHSESYSAGIFCRRLHNVRLTGDARTDLVNVAMSQIGYCEGDNKTDLSGWPGGSKNYTEYGLWYNQLQDEPGGYERAMWCAMFVSWCANQAGIEDDTVFYHAYTVYGVNWFAERDQAYTRKQVEDGEYVPQPGDIVYFKSSRNGDKVNHVGIVVKFEDGILYAVEGNTNDTSYSTNGGQVCLKSYEISDTFIRYICCPDYDT
jgi:hypothetical protein